MALGDLLNQIKDAVVGHSNDQAHTGFDPSGLLNQVEGLFGQHAQNTGQDLSPSGMDPYGDPSTQAGGRFANAKSSNEDQYGDPGDTAQQFKNVKSSKDDPYGDPG